MLNHSPLVLEPKPAEAIDYLAHAELGLSSDGVIIVNELKEVQLFIIPRISQEDKLWLNSSEICDRLHLLLTI